MRDTSNGLPAELAQPSPFRFDQPRGRHNDVALLNLPGLISMVIKISKRKLIVLFRCLCPPVCIVDVLDLVFVQVFLQSDDILAPVVIRINEVLVTVGGPAGDFVEIWNEQRVGEERLSGTNVL